MSCAWREGETGCSKILRKKGETLCWRHRQRRRKFLPCGLCGRPTYSLKAECARCASKRWRVHRGEHDAALAERRARRAADAAEAFDLLESLGL